MRALLSGCVLFFSCLALCVGQEPGEIQNLTAGRPTTVILTPEHGATFRLDLKELEAQEFFLEGAVPDISYRIAASDGSEVLSGRLATFGWAAIAIAIPGQREVQIQLRTDSAVEGLPGVRVRAEWFPVPVRTLLPRIRAAKAFNTAQSLHRSLRAEDLRLAIAQFQLAAQVWAQAGDSYGEALALSGKAESEIELSRYDDATHTLEQAFRVAANNAYLRGRFLHLETRIFFDQWEGKQAKNYAEEELRLGEEIEDLALIALARTDLAGVAYWNGDSNRGKLADQAHDEAIAAGEPDTLALERRWKGWIEENVERAARAMSLLSESESQFLRAGDSRNALDAALEIAVAASLNGDLYAALTKFTKIDPLIRDSGNKLEYGVLLGDIGFEYKELNNPKLALTYYRRAEAAYSGQHILFGLMLSHGNICETELQLSDATNAISDCKVSLRLARQFGNPVFISLALWRLGSADRKAGNLTQAFADFTEAVSFSKTGKEPRWESRAHIQLGELLEQQEKRQEALTEFQQAKTLSRGVSDPANLLEAQYAVARWYAHDGQYDKADAELTPALETLEVARESVSSATLQASYFAAERKCYELAVELRMRQLSREQPEGAEAQARKLELALEMSERGRARGLLDSMSARFVSGTRENGEPGAHLMNAKLSVDRAFDHRLKLLVEGGAKHELEANSAELAKALGDLERTEEDVHAAASQAIKPAPTMSAAEIESAGLASGVTFLEYALGDERSFLWVIDGGTPKSYVLPPRQKLENMVKRWRSLAIGEGRGEADAHAKLRNLSARLSCALFADAVNSRMTRMVIVPDGGLAMLPFAALPENGCSSLPGKPLVVGHEISLSPSLSVYLAPKRAPESGSFQGEVAIVADPVFDSADPRVVPSNTGASKSQSHPVRYSETSIAIPRLLNAGYEAIAIQETVRKSVGKDRVFVAQGFDASVETVLSPAMQNYRIWHLATHGVYDETMPEFSGLVFSLIGSDGGPRFGFLKASDIARLNVAAELVVLSACDSAAGENVNGEGIMGLSYAFLRAGAKQVVSTLWSVDDTRSRELMTAFYGELMRNGGNAAAALRESQLKVMRQRASASPYYWAGFELTSVGKQPPKPE